MSKQESVKKALILQAIKDLNWDISNTYEYDDSYYKDYTHLFLWEDGDYCLGRSGDFQDTSVCTCICTVDEFYNYGVISKNNIIKPVKAFTYYGDL